MVEKEYIEREAFVESQHNIYCVNCDRRKDSKGKFAYFVGDAPCRSCGIMDVLDDVEDFPAADVRPVVRGTWQFHMFTVNAWGYECRVCHTTWDEPTNFCPNCGADMTAKGRNNE